jgi:uncharacterized Tic20 family protein
LGSKHIVVLSNPIIVALIVTGIVFLVMFFIMRKQVELVDSSTKKYIYFVCSVGLYTFIGVVITLYLHHNILKSALEKKYGVGEAEDIVNAAIEGRVISSVRHF